MPQKCLKTEEEVNTWLKRQLSRALEKMGGNATPHPGPEFSAFDIGLRRPEGEGIPSH